MFIDKLKTTKRASKSLSVKSLKMSRQLSQTSKAVRERRSRERDKERKRFEGTLRKFIEHKYGNIFEEYTELYNLMVSIHLNTRNLTKTTTFRDWMKSVHEASSSDILTTAIRETLGEDVNYIEGDEAANDQVVAENEADEAANVQVDVENEADEAANVEVDVENEADEAANVEVDVENEADEAANAQVDVQNQADDIINELIEDEAIRDILNAETEDEGIEISLFDDIAFDIEPFDFDLEVEGYGY